MGLLKRYAIKSLHDITGRALKGLLKFSERTHFLCRVQMLGVPCGLCYCSRLRVYFWDVYRGRGVMQAPASKKTAFSFTVTTCDRSSKRYVTAMRMILFIATWSRSAPSWLARKIPPRWSCAVSVLPYNSQPRSLMALVRSYLFLIHLRFLYAINFTWHRDSRGKLCDLSSRMLHLTIINDALPTSNKVLYMWHTRSLSCKNNC